MRSYYSYPLLSNKISKKSIPKMQKTRDIALPSLKKPSPVGEGFEKAFQADYFARGTPLESAFREPVSKRTQSTNAQMAPPTPKVNRESRILAIP